MATNPGSKPSARQPANDATQALDSAELDALQRVPGPVVLQPGERPIPDYELVERLGAGGFGEVWRAKGPGGFAVALKFLPLDKRTGSTETRALDVMKDIRHANLLTQFGVWQLTSHLMIAMELGDRTLFDRLIEAEEQGQSGIPGPELLDYMRDGARGLDHLHERGIQHRDIKPQNFLLVGGSLKVADYGLAKVIDKNLASNSGSMTPAYAAPEFFKGKTSVHSDQYSFAVSYCQLRGGKLPFEGSTTEIMYGHLENQPDLSMLPEVERDAIAKALSKNPDERYPSCRAFVQALAEAMATPDNTERLPKPVILQPPHAPATASPMPHLTTAPRPTGGNTALVAVGLLALVLIGAGLAWQFLKESHPNDDQGANGRENRDGVLKDDGKTKVVTPPEKDLAKGKEKDGDKDKSKVIPMPVAELKVAGIAPLSLKAGGVATLTVKVERIHLPGPIFLELEGLPAGVKAAKTDLAAGETIGKIEVTADANAKSGPADVTLLARAGDLRAPCKFRLDVIAAPAELAKELSNSVGQKYVLIPAGKFLMGSPAGEVGRKDDESPQHEVQISKPFYLGKHEVTRGQFRAFVIATGYETEAERDGKGAQGYNAGIKSFEGPDAKYIWKNTGFSETDSHPVVNVTWQDAKAYCDWLSKKEGKKYDLPTEAQWEYACRAGTTSAYPKDDPDAMVEIANLADGSAREVFGGLIPTISPKDGHVFTAPVGQFKPNAWGLYDMQGNVWEWCRDWYSAESYGGAAKDPGGPQEGERRVSRGGSWTNPPARCRAANRDKQRPEHRHPTIGFRVGLYPE